MQMTGTWFPRIDTSLCDERCNICISFCPRGVFRKHHGKADAAYPEKCIEACDSCAKICPKKAIVFTRNETIKINGAVISVNGLADALKKGSVKEAINHLRTLNYIPPAMEADLKEGLKKLICR